MPPSERSVVTQPVFPKRYRYSGRTGVGSRRQYARYANIHMPLRYPSINRPTTCPRDLSPSFSVLVLGYCCTIVCHRIRAKCSTFIPHCLAQLNYFLVINLFLMHNYNLSFSRRTRNPGRFHLNHRTRPIYLRQFPIPPRTETIRRQPIRAELLRLLRGE